MVAGLRQPEPLGAKTNKHAQLCFGVIRHLAYVEMRRARHGQDEGRQHIPIREGAHVDWAEDAVCTSDN